MAEKIIQFPKTKKDTPPQTFEEMYFNIQTVRRERIEIAIYEIVPIIHELLLREGFDIDTKTYLKDSALIIESIRSALCRLYDIDHELQELADKSFKNLSDFNIDVDASPQANNQV